MTEATVATFVNRKKELSDIARFIGTQESQNVLIVAADSGVGKSRLTREAQKKASTTAIRISIGDVPSAIIPDGLVVQKLAHLLSVNASKHNAVSLSTYFLKFLPKTVRSSVVKVLIKKATGWLTDDSDAQAAIEKTVASALQNQSNLLEEASPQVTGFASEYVKYCAKNFDFNVVIESSHLVDISSAEFLIKVLSKNQKIIFEYTTDNSKNFSLEHFLELFSERKKDIRILKLAPLSPDEAVKLVIDDIHKMTAFVQNQFVASNGNLRPLIDAALLLSRGYNLPDQLRNATERLLRTITPDQKFIISLLALNENPTQLKDIIEASKIYNITMMNESSVRSCLANLIGPLVHQNQVDQFTIAHDFIRHVVSHDSEYKKFNFLALDCWRRMYQGRVLGISSGSSDHDLINHFRFALLCGDFDESVRLIPNLIEVAVRSVEPTPIVTLLKATLEKADLDGAIDESQTTELRLKTISMLFSVGLDKEALKFIEMEKASDIIFDVYKILCFSRLGMLDKALNLVAKISSESLTLGAQIIIDVLSILVKRNRLTADIGRREMSKIFAKYEQTNHVNVGFLYRSAIIYHDPEEALSLIKKSVRIFEDNADLFQADVSKIHVATRAALLGSKDDAYRLQGNVEESLNEQAGYYPVLLNNRACIDIMSNNVNSETAEILQHAESIAKEHYSLTAIKINQMLAYIALKDSEKSKGYLIGIEAFIAASGTKEKNLTVHAKYAMLKYHEMWGSSIEKAYYERLLLEDADAPDPVIQKLLNKRPINRSHGELHIYPRTLGFWNPDFKGLRAYFE